MKVAVFGAGGHGKVLADAALEAGHEVIGFLDDARAGATMLGMPVLSATGFLAEGAASVSIALGVGDNRARERIASRCLAAGYSLATVVHPSARVSRFARVGAGTVIFAGAAVNPDADLGEGVIVNTGAVVEHDVRVGRFAHLSPNAAIAGGGALGAFSHLGTGAVVLPLVTIGDRTVVGAGAVVNRPLPDDVVAHGVPARVRRASGEHP